MQTPAEMVEGTVEARNDKGVRVNGNWYNVSKFRPLDIALPGVGDHVRVFYDSKGFLTDVESLEQDPPRATDPATVRLAVLQAAATFAATRTDIKSADVLRIAEHWLGWVFED